MDKATGEKILQQDAGTALANYSCMIFGDSRIDQLRGSLNDIICNLLRKHVCKRGVIH